MRKNYASNARIPALGYGAVQKKDEIQVAHNYVDSITMLLHKNKRILLCTSNIL